MLLPQGTGKEVPQTRRGPSLPWTYVFKQATLFFLPRVTEQQGQPLICKFLEGPLVP